MADGASEPSEREERLFEALESFLRDPAHRAFAVVDGSLVDNLPRRLADEGLDHRSLVHDSAGRNVAATGVWLVDPAASAVPAQPGAEDAGAEALSDAALEKRAEAMTAAAKAAMEAGDETGGGAFSPARGGPADPVAGLRAIRRLAGAGPGVVFWCGNAQLTPEALFRHLRGIGRVVLEAPREEVALFRHADANVLAQVAPALDEADLARLLGPADFLLFAPDEAWGGGLKRIRRPAGPIAATPGMLRLRPGSMRTLQTLRLEASRAKVASYLRKVAPEETAGLDDAQLLQRVRSYEATGSQAGLRSERAQAQWSFLMLTTGGTVAGDREVRAALAARRSGGADAALDQMMRHMARRARRDAAVVAREG